MNSKRLTAALGALVIALLTAVILQGDAQAQMEPLPGAGEDASFCCDGDVCKEMSSWACSWRVSCDSTEDCEPN